MKIGLIAMSGVRAADPEILAAGLTLPGFVERSKVIASLPSLGLLTLAGMTPRDHEVSYHEVADIRTMPALPSDFDLVAISTFSAQVFEAYELADRIRAGGTKVVIGGLHATSVPDEAAEHCDAVAVGEGELIWPRVLADAERGELQRVYRSQPAEFDLSHSPMPRFELLDIPRYNRLTVQTSRGCPLRCDFCASSILLTNRYKQKPAERVLAEIDRIRELWPRPFIELADDNSFIDHRYWKSLLPQLAERRVRWFTETDVSVGGDDELLTLMRQSGCVEVLIGLESPVEDGLHGLELRSDWKRKRFPQYRELVLNIQRHGIRVNGCFIVGLDGHDATIFDRVFRAAKELELFDVQITFPTPFPGTPLYRRLKAEGRLLRDEAWDRCTLFDVNFRPSRMSAEELRTGFIALGTRLYSEECTRQRHDTFNRKYRRARRNDRAAASDTDAA